MATGCATVTYSFKPAEGQGTKIETNYVNGNAVIISHGVVSTVSVSGLKTETSEFLFYIGVKNNSSAKMDVVPEKITVASYNSKGVQRSLKVFTAHEYINGKYAAVDQRAFLEVLGKGAQVAADVALIPMATTFTAARVLTHIAGPVASAVASGISATYQSGYNEVKNILHERQSQNSVAAEKAYIQSLEQKMLKRNTLEPGQEVSGVVMIEYHDVTKLVVTVPFGSDTHSIELIPG